jgi:hypothetical protein
LRARSFPKLALAGAARVQTSLRCVEADKSDRAAARFDRVAVDHGDSLGLIAFAWSIFRSGAGGQGGAPN